MAEQMKLKSGSKLQMAFDNAEGKEPDFNMVCTFYKMLDTSAFLVSIPMHSGKPLAIDETRKLLIRSNNGIDQVIFAGYADDVVKEGIRSYWRIRRVSAQRQYFIRADERLKVSLHVSYKQETWAVDSNGEIVREEGLSLDISNGGIAFYLPNHFDVGEICEVTLPRVGTSPEGKSIKDVIGVVCWCREAPKGSPFRNVCGLQFRFADAAEKEELIRYVSNIKKRFAL